MQTTRSHLPKPRIIVMHRWVFMDADCCSTVCNINSIHLSNCSKQ